MLPIACDRTIDGHLLELFEKLRLCVDEPLNGFFPTSANLVGIGFGDEGSSVRSGWDSYGP